MDQWRIIYLTMIKEWKTTGGGIALVLKYITDAARGAALAWIIYQSGNLESLGFLAIGVALLAVWSGGSAFGGWALEIELNARTLDHALISRTSLPLVLFSKILAQIVYEIPSGVIAGSTVLLVAGTIPSVANPGALIFSLFLAMAGMTIICTFLAALTVLAGAKAGAMIGVVPFGAVLCGLILPVGNLPLALEIPARFLPSSWAMDGIWYAVSGTGSWEIILLSWTVSMAVCAIWYFATGYLCKVVERRVRIEGTLSSS